MFVCGEADRAAVPVAGEVIPVAGGVVPIEGEVVQ
jgi:hypothetical protein